MTVNHPGRTIYDQLKDGARFLDLRVALSTDTSDQTYWIVHEFVTSRFSEALYGLLQFIEENTGEVVVVQVRPKYNIQGTAKTKALMDYIENFKSPQGKTLKELSFIKRHSAGTTFSQCGTIGNLVTMNKRILLVWQTYNGMPFVTDTWFMWREAFFPDKWKQGNDVANKHIYLLNDLERAWGANNGNANGRLYNVQFIVTPASQDMVWDSTTWNQTVDGIQNSIGLPSLKDVAYEMNPTLDSFIFHSLNASVRNYTTIYTMDFNYDHRFLINSIARRVIAERVGSSASILAASFACLLVSMFGSLFF